MLDLPVGEIAPGRLGDLVALDLGHPSLHPPNALMKNVVYALSPQAITDVWVHAASCRDGAAGSRPGRRGGASPRTCATLTRDWVGQTRRFPDDLQTDRERRDLSGGEV